MRRVKSNFETTIVLTSPNINKPGTAQVGFISKAQKYSRNNNRKNFFFRKTILVKKKHKAEKPKKRPFRLFQRFLQTENLKKLKRYPLREFKNFRKNVPKGGPFGLPSTFGSIKNLWLGARLEPTLSCFSAPENPGLTSRPTS